MALNETTIVWDERVQGFTSFLTYAPDTGFSLNNRFFTLGDGGAYEHNRTGVARGTFYGNTFDSEVEVIFNDSPSSVKSFKTIGYEGVGNWKAEIVTDQESKVIDEDTIPVTRTVSGIIPSEDFVNREGKYFSEIKGRNTGYNTPDVATLLVSGVGVGTVAQNEVTLPTVPIDVRKRTVIDNEPEDHNLPNGTYLGDRLFFYNVDINEDAPQDGYDTDNLLYAGEILDINNNVITFGIAVPVGTYVHYLTNTYENTSDTERFVTSGTGFLTETWGPDNARVWIEIPAGTTQEAPRVSGVNTGSFFLTSKSEEVETSGIKGFFAIIKMTTDSPDVSELFSISSEVSESSS